MVHAHRLLSESRSKSSVRGRARSSLGDGRHELPGDNRVGSPGRGKPIARKSRKREAVYAGGTASDLALARDVNYHTHATHVPEVGLDGMGRGGREQWGVRGCRAIWVAGTPSCRIVMALGNPSSPPVVREHVLI